MIQKRLAIIGICVVAIHCSFVSVLAAGAFTEADLLTRKIQATTIKNKTFDQVLDILTIDYQIPVGIELSASKLPRRKINLELPETNLKEFLNAVFAKDPQYTWKLEGDVINVWPLTGRDALMEILLETKISHFSFTEAASTYRIHGDIMDLPEIKTKLIVAGVDPMIFLNSGTMVKVGKGIWFDETNLTLRQLLNTILKKTESKRWVLYRWGDNNEYITLTS
jgi:hypothetical protein